MDWLNIHVATLDSPEFLGSEPTDRATWLCMLRYCAGQENGGLIRDCKSWADRKWQQLAGITKPEAERKCALWKWEHGSDIRVWAYPVDKEAQVRKNRISARQGAVSRWKSTPLMPGGNGSGNAERKGREGECKGETKSARPKWDGLGGQEHDGRRTMYPNNPL